MRFLISLFLVTTAVAHTDLSTKITALTAEIAKNPTATLHYQRATEYRALRQDQHAIEDLQKALEIDPHHAASLVALAELYGPDQKAVGLLQSYAASASSPTAKLESLYLLSRHFHLAGNQEEALKIYQKALLVSPAIPRDTAMDLLHADILLGLNRPADAATALQAGWIRTNSIVLRNHWIDTALTAGRTDGVLPVVEEELQTSRLRSSWLIRRARALMILGKRDQARNDLRAALAEIQPRIDPAQPDLTLIADRGLIHALMGNHELARRDLTTLQESHLPPSAYRLLSHEFQVKRK